MQYWGITLSCFQYYYHCAFISESNWTYYLEYNWESNSASNFKTEQVQSKRMIWDFKHCLCSKRSRTSQTKCKATRRSFRIQDMHPECENSFSRPYISFSSYGNAWYAGNFKHDYPLNCTTQGPMIILLLIYHIYNKFQPKVFWELILNERAEALSTSFYIHLYISKYKYPLAKVVIQHL